jgi:hypothetical protein
MDTTMIQKTHGMDFSKVLFCYQWVSNFFWQLRLKKFNRQAFKHIFTSPTSVDQEPKANHSGNAHIHGMTSVTLASIAYVATQVSHCSWSACPPFLNGPSLLRCALLWAPCQYFPGPIRRRIRNGSTIPFSSIWRHWEEGRGEWSCHMVEPVGVSLAFLNIILSLVLLYFIRQIFPTYSVQRPICKNSALARIKKKRSFEGHPGQCWKWI